MRHLADATLATGRQAQRKQGDVDTFLPRYRVADRFCELGFTRADIAGQNDERRPPEDGVHQSVGAGMVLARPCLQSARVDQQAQDVGETGFLLVEADQPGQPLLRLEIRIRDPALEQLVETRFDVHGQLLTLARSSARPPAE